MYLVRYWTEKNKGEKDEVLINLTLQIMAIVGEVEAYF